MFGRFGILQRILFLFRVQTRAEFRSFGLCVMSTEKGTGNTRTGNMSTGIIRIVCESRSAREAALAEVQQADEDFLQEQVAHIMKAVVGHTMKLDEAVGSLVQKLALYPSTQKSPCCNLGGGISLLHLPHNLRDGLPHGEMGSIDVRVDRGVHTIADSGEKIEYCRSCSISEQCSTTAKTLMITLMANQQRSRRYKGNVVNAEGCCIWRLLIL
jgi:hypothetical protein